MSDIELVVGYATLTKANQEIVKTGKYAKDSVAQFRAAFSLADTWQKKFQVEQGKVNASLNKHYLEAQKSNKVAKDSAAVFVNEAKELERLNLKFLEGHRATVLYKKEELDLALAREKGIISLEQEKMALDSLSISMAKGTGIFSGLGTQVGNTRNKMNSTGMAVQQLGYQMGDFAVQVQSGQSAFVAFSQQATQLVGILPTVASQLGLTMKMAIGLSAGLGVAIPVGTAVLGMLYRLYTGSDEASEGVKSFEDRLKSAREEMRGGTEDLRLLNSGFKNLTELTLDDAIKKAEESLEGAVENLKRIQDSLVSNNLSNYGSDIALALEAGLEARREEISLAKEAVKSAQDELDLAISQRVEQERISDLRDSQLDAQNNFIQLLKDRDALQRENWRAAREEIAAQEEANELKAIELQYGKESLEYLNEQQAIQRAVLEKRIEEERLTEGIADGLREALGLAQAFELVDMGVGIRAAEADTNALIARLTVAVNKAAELDTATPDLAFGKTTPIAKPTDDPLSSWSYLLDNKPSGSSPSGTRKPSGGGSSRSSKIDNQKTLLELEEMALKTRELANEIGLEGEQLRMVADIRKQLGDTENNYSDEAIRNSANRIVAYEMAQEALEKAQAAQEDLAEDMASSMGDAFSDWVDGTKSFKDAFRDMADDIIKQLFEILVVQRLVGNFNASTGSGSGLAGFIGPLLGGLFADGAAFNKGSVVPFATGGVVSSATMFPMSGGKSGVMGEAGPEAIMPLTRGADGKLGVKASGGGSSGGTTISISVDARGAQVGVAEQIDAKLRVLAPKLVAQSVATTKKSMTKTKKGWA